MIHKMQYWLEETMLSAVRSYFLYGLHPGSCTTALICGDYDTAYQHAHPLLKDQDGSAHPLELCFEYIENVLPVECQGEENYHKWIEHRGYEGADINMNEQDLAIKQWTMEDAINAYYRKGREPAHFVKLMFKGDLMDLHSHCLISDIRSTIGELDDMITHVHNSLPEQCLGDNVDRWIELGGLDAENQILAVELKLSSDGDVDTDIRFHF